MGDPPDNLRGNWGQVVSVRGSVIEVRFDRDLPPLNHLLTAGSDGQVLMEVADQLDARTVRGLSLTPAHTEPADWVRFVAFFSHGFSMQGPVLLRTRTHASIAWALGRPPRRASTTSGNPVRALRANLHARSVRPCTRALRDAARALCANLRAQSARICTRGLRDSARALRVTLHSQSARICTRAPRDSARALCANLYARSG